METTKFTYTPSPLSKSISLSFSPYENGDVNIIGDGYIIATLRPDGTIALNRAGCAPLGLTISDPD
jgi:hypothetical protein